MPDGELARSPRLTWPSGAAEGNRHLLPEALIAERVARVGRCADFLQLHRLRFAAEQLQIRCSSVHLDRKSTRLNSSHGYISYAVFCLKKKKKNTINRSIIM